MTARRLTNIHQLFQLDFLKNDVQGHRRRHNCSAYKVHLHRNCIIFSDDDKGRCHISRVFHCSSMMHFRLLFAICITSISCCVDYLLFLQAASASSSFNREACHSSPVGQTCLIDTKASNFFLGLAFRPILPLHTWTSWSCCNFSFRRIQSVTALVKRISL